jgi:radical SAM protein with 4Fe4S-binding SPASM domain
MGGAVDRKAVPILRLVFWETTAACNLECVHCRRLDVAREMSKLDMTTEQACKMIDRLADFARPILVFSGGEPLIRPDLFQLAEQARGRGLMIALATNGTLIDPAMASRITAAGFDRVSISLDGADAATHDAFRQLAGSFDRAMGGLRHLHEQGVPTQVNCTIARHNAGQMPDVLKLAERVGAVAAHFFLLVPVGCGEQIAENQMLSGQEIEDLLGQLYELSRSSPLQVKATCAPHYYRIVRQQRSRTTNSIPTQDERVGGTVGGRASCPPAGATPAAQSPGQGHPMHAMTRGCLAGTGVCFVSHTGEVFPCGYFPVKAGNVLEQDFAEIWQQSEVFERLRDQKLLTGKCGRCHFKGVCGGCRARALYEFGDYMAEEPFCVYQP